MKTIGFLLRLFTLACYFLPFTFYMSTCVGDKFKTAYNKKEAFVHISEAHQIQLKQINSEMNKLKSELNQAGQIDSLRRLLEKRFNPFANSQRLNFVKDSLENNFKQDLLYSMVYPNAYSISAIAILFDYKNVQGRVLMIVSVCASLIALFFRPLLKKVQFAV